MFQAPEAPLVHILCALLLVARIADLGSTYFLTPNLALEANPIIRKLGWRYALLTIGVCALPYFSMEMGIAILIPTLFVAASNASRVWTVRTMGQEAYLQWAISVARRSKLSHALLCVGASTFFIILAGASTFLFYPSPDEWGFWIGGGIVIHGVVVVGFYGTLSTRRLFRKAADADRAAQMDAAGERR